MKLKRLILLSKLKKEKNEINDIEYKIIESF